MRRGKDASLKALISAMAEAESKSYYEEQENALNDLSGLLKTFLNRDDSPERVRIRKDYEAGAALTGKGGIRQRLGAVDMEFFGRAYFPHYFSRPSPEFHRELDAIWQDGVLKGLTPSTPKLVKQISRMDGCKRVVAAPRGHAKSTSLTFKGTIHAVVYGYKHYPIIISDSSDQAEGFLDNIRVEFEENEAIREDFGDLTGKVWRSNVLVTSTNIKVEAIGSGKKIRGRKHRNWRPDLLILDDIENDENVRTPEQRAKLDSWFKKRFLRPVMIIQILSTSEPCSITTACWRILLKTLDTRRLSTGQLYRFHRKQTCGRSGKISSLTCLMKTMRKMHESSLKRTGKRCWLGQKFSGRKSSLTMT